MDKTNMIGVRAVCCVTLMLVGCGGAEQMREADEELPTDRAPLARAQQELEATGFQLKNRINLRCLAAGTSVGADAYLTGCDPTRANQRWYFDGGLLKQQASGLCLEIENASVTAGAYAQVSTCNRTSNEEFRFYPVRASAGTIVTEWYLIAQHSGRCVSAEGAFPGVDQDVIQASTCSSLSNWSLSF